MKDIKEQKPFKKSLQGKKKIKGYKVYNHDFAYNKMGIWVLDIDKTLNTLVRILGKRRYVINYNSLNGIVIKRKR